MAQSGSGLWRRRGSASERGKILDRPDKSLLRLLAHPADAHVLDHLLAQRVVLTSVIGTSCLIEEGT
jgi:hypothetical protein